MDMSTAGEDMFVMADEVDEPPPPPEAYSVSRQHTLTGTDAPLSQPLDSIAQQARDADRSPQTSSNRPAPGSLRPPLKRDSSAPGLTEVERSVTAPSSDGFRAQSEEYFRNLRQEREAPGFQQGQMQEDSGTEQPQDSLSLGQLKKLLQDMPKSEPTPYAFEYADASSFEEELEELFDYSAEERQALLNAQQTFSARWSEFKSSRSGSLEGGGEEWQHADSGLKIQFLHHLKDELLSDDPVARILALDCALYLALGCWLETAAAAAETEQSTDNGEPDESDEPLYAHAKLQVSAIEHNVQMIAYDVGVDVFYRILRQTYTDLDDISQPEAYSSPEQEQQALQQRWASIVVLYLLVDIGRRKWQDTKDQKLRTSILNLQPSFLNFLTRLLVRSRWDETDDSPLSKLLLLFWKTLHLFFGGTAEINSIKSAFAAANAPKDSSSGPLITASPLDYHMFRQEIVSKYPAFNPPPALFPFEPENNSILPPLQEHASRLSSISAINSDAGPANIQGAGTSIMQQPVHIATPAPSPPPSPAGPGGKGIKKQNYQTNQMFPFMYPPLDESSNNLGGKGTTELQDLLAGRKWHGSDIPASILEAADLFSKRMRATRAMKQLWEERVRFLKFERGYDPVDEFKRKPDSAEKDAETESDPDLSLLEDDLRQRLMAVDEYYEDALPRLQSVVIVLVKVLLLAVTTLITQPHGAEGLRNGELATDLNGQPRAGDGPQPNGDAGDMNDATLHDLSTLRAQEITGKAVSGILLLLLKWFKLSHILKFEYFSQLLLDSNYIQFILKLFTHQELERVVTFKCERVDLNFFTLCRTYARRGTPSEAKTHSDIENHMTSSNPDSEAADSDDAAPPPIRLARKQQDSSPASPTTSKQRPRSDSSSPPLVQSSATYPDRPAIPEVDELGYPVSQLPQTPITHYSWRTFFTSINHLRILQKLVKAKPHRQLLMVQSKYSLTLKKHLKVPQHDIRLYTLKIIKGQVPYCHRKWRASNMRIITAIYLHVKPGFRDEWLSGLDVEQEIGEALPLEQALRALTFWWHLRTYPTEFGVANGIGENAIDDISDDLRDLDLGDAEIPADSERDDTAAEESKPGDSMIGNGGAAHPENDKPFDINYDPFTADSSTAAPLSPPGHRRRSLRDSDKGSAPSSRRPSATLLASAEEDDFFLRELEKMDLGAAFPGVGGDAQPPPSPQPRPRATTQSLHSAAPNHPPQDAQGAPDYLAAADAEDGAVPRQMLFFPQGEEAMAPVPVTSGVVTREEFDMLPDREEVGVFGYYTDALAADAAEVDADAEIDDSAPALVGSVDEEGNVVISTAE